MKKKHYIISAVIPVYNTEEYLAETIDSVINQDIGIENIQIILVDDGSTDSSGSICDEYSNRFPESIQVIHKENGGVSSARNSGMKYVEGTYVNFLDSDDKWEKDAFKKATMMLDKNCDIDVVSVRMKFFGSTNRYHILDYKFDGDKIVDLNENYDYIQLHINSSIIRTSAAKKHIFDEDVILSEDAKYLFDVLFQKSMIGILSSATFFYRRRDDDTSAIGGKRQKKEWYIDTPDKVYHYMLNKSSEDKNKNLFRYSQFFVAYDLKWRLKEPVPEGVLSEEEKNLYYRSIISLIRHIDKDIITDDRLLTGAYRIYALNLMYGKSIYGDLKWNKDKLMLDKYTVIDFRGKRFIKVLHFSCKDGNVVISGLIDKILDDGRFSVKAKLLHKEISLDLKESRAGRRQFLQGEETESMEFELTINADEFDSLEFLLFDGEKFARKLDFRTGLSSGICEKERQYLISNRNAFFVRNSEIIKCKANIKNRIMLFGRKAAMRIKKNRTHK